jgi:hypothetical protein
VRVKNAERLLEDCRTFDSRTLFLPMRRKDRLKSSLTI